VQRDQAESQNLTSEYIVEATILTGCAQGETLLVPRIPLIRNDLPVRFKRLQFPLKVCFAMTTNKSRDKTLKFAE